MTRLLTVGHGTATTEQLLATLQGAQVAALVDVRRFPGSRRHPHLGRDALQEALPAAGVGYRWEPRLGGRRALAKAQPSPDTWWTVTAFRAYALHTRTPEFTAALEELLAQAGREVAAVMCSETVWWRCHRRLIADVAVLQHGAQVEHVLPSGLVRHVPAAGARLAPDGAVVWDGGDGTTEAPPR